MHRVLDIPNAQYGATTTAAANAATGLVAGKRYRVAVSTASMIAQGSTPTAALAAGSSLVQPGDEIILDGVFGAVLSCRTVAGTGYITVTPLLDLGP